MEEVEVDFAVDLVVPVAGFGKAFAVGAGADVTVTVSLFAEPKVPRAAFEGWNCSPMMFAVGSVVFEIGAQVLLLRLSGRSRQNYYPSMKRWAAVPKVQTWYYASS